MDYSFTLTGKTPLIMHADNIMMQEELELWRKDPKNASLSKPGDDRSPVWTWLAYLHRDEANEFVAMPQEAIMAALRFAGAQMKMKGAKTFKSLTQTAIVIPTEFCALTTDGRRVAYADCLALRQETAFVRHFEGVKDLGFELLVKRVRLAKSRNVRVRPIFRDWEVTGTFAVEDEAFTPEVLQLLFDLAGSKAGLLEWRPNAKEAPGPYGQFTAALQSAKARRRAG
jgi:hypothetical protein